MSAEEYLWIASFHQPKNIMIVDDPESKGRNGPMSSTVLAVPATRVHDSYILPFLKDAKCSVRIVEVRLFKTSC